MLPDLRKYDCHAIIERVQRSLDAQFDFATEIRKRRSLGYRTTRETWVRIELRDLARIDDQGWGIEEASVLEGVAMPAWHQGLSWMDHELGAMWRVDETELITDPTVKLGGILTDEPELPDAWWAILNSSLDALAKHPTTRVATSAGSRITQERISATIHQVFPDVDTTIDEWTTAHADFAWPNLTALNCCVLDWEDWGVAPRGYDAATLRGESLAVPALAERIYQERQTDLDSRSGRLSQLYYCAKAIAAGERSGPLLAPATDLANELVTALQV